MTADENFRPRRPQNPDDMDETPSLNLQEKMKQNPMENVPSEGAAFAIQGLENAPAEFLQKLKGVQSPQRPVERELSGKEPKRGLGEMTQTVAPVSFKESAPAAAGHLKEVLEGLKRSSTVYDEIELPSKGRFYDDITAPSNGIISLRPMTGEEENILATQRFVKKGEAVNMIFKRCIKEDYNPSQFLTIDRTYILIYLRGISYSPSYEVKVKCSDCEESFLTAINLGALFVEQCPDTYGPELNDVLPKTQLPFSYRLSTGKDEQDITGYRERKVKAFGDQAADDTLIYRTATLLNHIDGIRDKNELQILLKNLPVSDGSYIRNCINEPPFGVDTNIEISCPSCLHDFEVDLPLEASFFFPRRSKKS